MIADDAQALQVGPGLLQELHLLAAALALAGGHGLLEGVHHVLGQQRLQRRAIASGEGLDDHLEGLASALQETGDVEGRITRAHRR